MAQKILSVRKDLQIIVVGDFFQLPPVVKNSEEEFFKVKFGGEFAFNAPSWSQLNFQTVELSTVHRQKDHEFVRALNRIRTGDSGGIDCFRGRVGSPQSSDTTILTTTNRTAEAINSKRLNQLPGPTYKAYPQKSEGFEEKDFPVPYELRLKPGALVIACVNDPEGKNRFFNGQTGKVVGINKEDECVEVEFKHGTINIERHQWKIIEYRYNKEKKKIVEEVKGVYSHYPLKLAWAVTIHKSQGMSLANVHVDLNRGAFAHGQTYVALSRAESLEGLTLAAPIKHSDLIVDSKVSSFIESETKTTTTTPAKGRGGARPGAGRKALNPCEKKTQVSVWLSPELLHEIDSLEGESRSKKIEQILIQQLLEKPSSKSKAA